MEPERELAHLRAGAGAEVPPGEVDELVVSCPVGAQQVLAGVREVLEVVLAHQARLWPSVADWKQLLPEWFVSSCVDDSQVRDCVLDKWSLRAWTYWFQADQRRWRWWNARADGDRLHVWLLVEERPYLRGALEWLLETAGAEEVADSPARS
jgi:hypothetical protein